MEVMCLRSWVQGEVQASSSNMRVAVQELGTKMGKVVFADCVGDVITVDANRNPMPCCYNRRCVVANCVRQPSVPALLRGCGSTASGMY